MSLKVIIITGASSGIGAATARLFAAEGYKVVLAARRMERLLALTAEIAAVGGEAFPIQTDVSQVAQLENLVEKTLEKYGQIDILLNNAGFGLLTWLDHQTLDEIESQIHVNITGVLLASRLVIPHMIKRKQGHIINVSSVAAWVAPPTYAVYAMTKFAVRGFTEGLRRELKGLGIRVSAIYPGAVLTEFEQHAGVSWKTEVTTPNWLLLSAEDVAKSILRIVNTGRQGIVTPWLMNVAIWTNAHIPALVDWVLAKSFSRNAHGSTAWGKIVPEE